MRKRGESDLVRAGQLDLLKDIAKEIRSTSQAEEKLLNVAVEIQQKPDAIELAYLARELVQCTLPHTDPGNVPLWTRTNGFVTLVIARTGFDQKTLTPIGYPYGSLPRLLLFWLNTEAVRTGNRRLEMGDTFASFIRELGLDPSRGGVRSDFNRLKDQMRRLFSASISFQQNLEANGMEGERRLNMHVAAQSELWWDPKKPDQVNMFGSWVELGDKLFQLMTAAPVPGDMRALRELKRSPLALDLYTWSTHKALAVSIKGKSQFVPWAGLKAQFGSGYAEVKDFKRYAVAAFRKIQIVYPGLKLESTPGGVIVLSTSRPAVPYKPSVRNLR